MAAKPKFLGAIVLVSAALIAFIAWSFLASSETTAREELEIATPAVPGDAPRGEGATSLATVGEAHASNVGAESRVMLPGSSGEGPQPQVEFELQGHDGKPLDAARAWLAYAGSRVVQVRADAAGVVRFDAAPGQGLLLVGARSQPPLSRTVATDAGRQVIQFDRGVAVSGFVRFEGELSGVELRLVSDRPLVDETSWPAALRATVDLDDDERLRVNARTDDEGNFEFRGLSQPWSGRLEIVSGHEIVAVSGGVWSAQSRSIRLDDPIEGLRIDLVDLPIARGRVVRVAGGEGVARAELSGTLTFDPLPGQEESARASIDGRTDDQGRFAIALRRRDRLPQPLKSSAWPALRQVSLRIDAGAESPRVRLELGEDQVPANLDFGELVLEPGAKLSFMVSDVEGKALAGAVARMDGQRSEPSDAEGRGTLAYVPNQVRPMAVSLEGYRDAFVTLPAEVTDVVRVTMERTNHLTVRVSDPDDSPAVGVRVAVRSDSGPVRRTENRRGRDLSRSTDEQGRAEFFDLTANVPLTVSVRDSFGVTLAQQTATLQEQGSVEIQLALPRRLYSFEGIVRDEQGLALADATVELQDPTQGDRSIVDEDTDASGRFRFEGLSSPTGVLRVRKGGFSSLTIVDFTLPPAGVVAELRLERGLRLKLRVVDVHGTLVAADALRLESPPDRPVAGQRGENSEWSFANLPRTTMVAVGIVGKREYRREIEPLAGDQDFQVPAHTTLEVELRLEADTIRDRVQLVLRANDDRRAVFVHNLRRELLQTTAFAPLRPGRYTIYVQRWQPDAGKGGEWVRVGAAQAVQLEDGRNPTLELAR